MIYIRVLNLKALRAILKADDDAEGVLRYLLDGQRTPILYNGNESIALLATVPKLVRQAMDAVPELFVEYTENELFDHEEQLTDDSGNKVFVQDDDGNGIPVMNTVKRTTDIFDTFYSTKPYPVTDEDGTRMVTPRERPMKIIGGKHA